MLGKMSSLTDIVGLLKINKASGLFTHNAGLLMFRAADRQLCDNRVCPRENAEMGDSVVI